MFTTPLIAFATLAVLSSLSAGSMAATKRVTRPPKAAPAPSFAATPDVELTPAQAAAASQVLLGQMPCELGQIVQITPISGKPGHFTLTFKNISYAVVPQETTTGAVRLEDRQARVVWLQIPAKSMLLNAKLGQRMADNCLHEQQRSVVAEAGSSLGIADAPAAPAAPAAPTVSAASDASAASASPMLRSPQRWPPWADRDCWPCSTWTSCHEGIVLDPVAGPAIVWDWLELARAAGCYPRPWGDAPAQAAQEAGPRQSVPLDAAQPTGRVDGL